MFRLYFGLLFVGFAAAAHASEAMGGDVLLSQPDQSSVQIVRSDTDYLSPYRSGDSSVVLNRTANNVALGGSRFGSSSELFSVFKPEKEPALATNARWSWSKNESGNRILSLARHKRVEFNGDRFKVTLRQDSASIEAGNLKVALRSGSTSMLWSKAL